jgi:hypothetical protein
MDPMTLFLQALGGAAGKTAAGEATKLLRELVGLEDAQLGLLRALDLKVDDLIAGPFHAGRQELGYALVAWRDPTDRKRLLWDARRSFAQALGQDREPLRRSFAHLHLVTVWLALGSINDVPPELQRAHLEALWAVGTAAYRANLGGMRRRLAQGPALEREVAAVRRIMPYANELARTRRAWGAPLQEAPLLVGASNEAEDTEEALNQDMIAGLVVLDETMLPTFPQIIKQKIQLPLSQELAIRRDPRGIEQQVRQGELVHYWVLGEWLEHHDPAQSS